MFDEFVNFILESYGDPFYSWVSSNGGVVRVKINHGEFARDTILKSRGVDNKHKNERTDYITLMFNLGWSRVTNYGNDVYLHNSVQPPSRKQLKAIIDLAIEHNKRRIIWDNEDTDRVLWTNEDY